MDGTRNRHRSAPCAAAVLLTVSIGGGTWGAEPRITPVGQQRFVAAQADARSGENQQSGQDLIAAKDFEPFAEGVAFSFQVGEAFAAGGGFQDSRIGSDAIAACGRIFANAELFEQNGSAHGYGQSKCGFTFDVSETSSFALTGTVEFFDSAIMVVRFTGPDGHVVDIDLIPDEITKVDESGVLLPGEYELFINASANLFAGPFEFDAGFAQYDLRLDLVCTASDEDCNDNEVPDLFELSGLLFATVDDAPAFLRNIDPTGGEEFNAFAMLDEGVASADALAAHPSTDELFALVRLQGSDEQHLAAIDASTGAVDLRGSFGNDEIYDLTFGPDGTLYVLYQPGLVTLNFVDPEDATIGAAVLLSFLFTSSGHTVAIDPHGVAYHASGTTFERAQLDDAIFEAVGTGVFADWKALTFTKGAETLVGAADGRLSAIEVSTGDSAPLEGAQGYPESISGLAFARTLHDANENCIADECEVTGDVNGDGIVDFLDLLALLAAWGPCPPESDCPADIDGSGEVDFDDLLLLLANWGSGG